MLGTSNATARALLLVSLMLIAPLSGCFGEDEVKPLTADEALTIDGVAASEVILRAGEWHDVLLIGEGLRLSAAAHDVLLFVNGSLDLDSSVPVNGDRVLVQLLTTPYTTAVELTVYTKDGQKTVVDLPITNGTPIVSGK